MPHPITSLPATGFQALILCGPGESLAPFNAYPADLPKALIPIANRPMVWYPLDFCYRAGITNITLICPPISQPAIEAALSQNPHLTSLPSPKPMVLAPKDAELSTGTAELMRLQEVQKAIEGDFVVLPCDLVCELPGIKMLEAWMTLQGSVGGIGHGYGDKGGGVSRKRSGRRGGLGVWYATKSTAEGGVGTKKEETDFLATTALTEASTPALSIPAPSSSLRADIRNVVMAMPTAALQDELEDNSALRIRQALLRRHGRVKMLTTHRDAHVYFFPYWVKEMIARNEGFDSLGEDVLGFWAKAGWQVGLAEKLGLGEVFGGIAGQKSHGQDGSNDGEEEEEEIDLLSLSSTSTSRIRRKDGTVDTTQPPFASRVTKAQPSTRSTTTSTTQQSQALQVPPLLSYIHPSHPPAPLIRRVDTVPLLLNISLYLAKLTALDETSAILDDHTYSTSTGAESSHFAHQSKVHSTSHPLPPQLTLSRENSLIDSNVRIAPRTTVRECVVGDGCVLGHIPETPSSSTPASTSTATGTPNPSSKGKNKPLPGPRLTRTLLMSSCTIGPGAKLTGCVLGRRCRVGANAELTDCYVQEGFVVPEGYVGKGEVLAVGVDELGAVEGGEYGDEEDEGDEGEDQEDGDDDGEED